MSTFSKNCITLCSVEVCERTGRPIFRFPQSTQEVWERCDQSARFYQKNGLPKSGVPGAESYALCLAHDRLDLAAVTLFWSIIAPSGGRKLDFSQMLSSGESKGVMNTIRPIANQAGRLGYEGAYQYARLVLASEEVCGSDMMSHADARQFLRVLVSVLNQHTGPLHLLEIRLNAARLLVVSLIMGVRDMSAALAGSDDQEMVRVAKATEDMVRTYPSEYWY